MRQGGATCTMHGSHSRNARRITVTVQPCCRFCRRPCPGWGMPSCLPLLRHPTLPPLPLLLPLPLHPSTDGTCLTIRLDLIVSKQSCAHVLYAHAGASQHCEDSSHRGHIVADGEFGAPQTARERHPERNRLEDQQDGDHNATTEYKESCNGREIANVCHGCCWARGNCRCLSGLNCWSGA